MSQKLDEILSGQQAPGVYRWQPPRATGALCKGAEDQGWRCFRLDGRRIANKAEFLAACATAMRFPSYFGQNWDALEECLRDLEWAPARRGYLVLYGSAGRFARSQPDEFATAIAILRSAVESWAATPTPMAVLLGGLGATGPDIAEL